jgi:hypothetical protein
MFQYSKDIARWKFKRKLGCSGFLILLMFEIVSKISIFSSKTKKFGIGTWAK